MPKKRRGDRRPNPKKRSSTSRSFYADFEKKVSPEQKITVVEAPNGLLEFLNHEGKVVGQQMIPEHVVREAERRGMTTDEVLKENEENTINNNILQAIKNKLSLDHKPSLKDPTVRKMYAEILKGGVQPYSQEIAMQIVEKYAAGERLREFLGKGVFPSWASYIRWRTRYKEFEEMMKQAKIARAERYIAEMEHAADEVNVANSKAAKVRIDALKHLASVHNPEEYGHRTKVVGDKNQPLAFTVVTGVPDSEWKDEGGQPALPEPEEESDE